MGKSAAKSKNRWADHYTRQAQKERFPARSVYKLKEIQKKYRLIRRGDRILDLGCAPGSWLLYAAEVTGVKGRVVGIDIKAVTVRLPDHAMTHTGDIRDLMDGTDPIDSDFDVILSDMAPATTGNKHTDAARSLDLCEAALEVAHQRLARGGRFVCKIFQGSDSKAFTDRVKAAFKQTKIFKPQSSRKASKEIYIIGMGKK
jgi:23S rRNA (uridine2552-2'-O)-methyltransferase